MTVTVAPTDASELRARFDAELAAFLDRQGPDWPDGAPRGVFTALQRFVLAGGKRLRPLFCYWGWRGAGGADGTPIVVAAAALELFHAFALIHDDILDGSDRRRGEPSVHRLFADLHARSSWRGDPEAYGRNTALLCGDLLRGLVGSDVPRVRAEHRAGAPGVRRVRADAYRGDRGGVPGPGLRAWVTARWPARSR